MATASNIIDALGGTSALASGLSDFIEDRIAPSTVSRWRRENHIPAWWRFIIRHYADAVGVVLDEPFPHRERA